MCLGFIGSIIELLLELTAPLELAEFVILACFTLL